MIQTGKAHAELETVHRDDFLGTDEQPSDIHEKVSAHSLSNSMRKTLNDLHCQPRLAIRRTAFSRSQINSPKNESMTPSTASSTRRPKINALEIPKDGWHHSISGLAEGLRQDAATKRDARLMESVILEECETTRILGPSDNIPPDVKLSSPNLLQLLQEHGINAILEHFESARISRDQLNEYLMFNFDRSLSDIDQERKIALESIAGLGELKSHDEDVVDYNNNEWSPARLFDGHCFSKIDGKFFSKDKITLEENSGAQRSFRGELIAQLNNFNFPFPDSEYDREFPPVSIMDSMNFSRLRKYTSLQIGKILEIFAKYGKNIDHTVVAQEDDPVLYLLKNLSGVKAFKTLDFGGQHGYALSFKDEDIARVHRSPASISSEGFPLIDGKHVILQKGTRACTAAAAAMLILDAAAPANVNSLKEDLWRTNLGTSKDMVAKIQAQGLIAIESSPQQAGLKNRLREKGPAIVTVNSGAGGHVVIVDSVNDNDTITLRDPAHGWMIDLKADSFWKAWDHGEILQASRALA